MRRKPRPNSKRFARVSIASDPLVTKHGSRRRRVRQSSANRWAWWDDRAETALAPFASRWGLTPLRVLEHDGDAGGGGHHLLFGERAIAAFGCSLRQRGEHVAQRTRAAEREALAELDPQRREAIPHAVRFDVLRHGRDKIGRAHV